MSSCFTATLAIAGGVFQVGGSAAERGTVTASIALEDGGSGTVSVELRSIDRPGESGIRMAGPAGMPVRLTGIPAGRYEITIAAPGYRG
jgi:hypothetical protein